MAKERAYDRDLIDRGARLAPRVSEVPAFCWMCPATSGQRAKEHIFPEWLLKVLGAEKELVHPTHRDVAGRVIIPRGPISLGSFVNGEVCEACNCGWMSDLEEEFKGLFLSRDALTAAERKVYARWVVKTGVTLNTCQNFRVMFPARTRHEVRWRIPQDVSVYLGKGPDDCPGNRIDFMQGMNSILFGTEENRRRRQVDFERSHHVAFRVGGLTAVVLYAPPDNWLAPTSPLAQLWPPDTALDLSALPVTEEIPFQGIVAERRVLRKAATQDA